MRVLLIEDDPRTALLISELLRSSWATGLVFVHAERLGDAAQELLDRGASVVVLDTSSSSSPEEPLLNVDQVRTAAPDVPIIVLSDHADEEIGVRAIRAGAQDYLFKNDLTAARLSRSVRFAIERKRSEVQLAHRALHDPLTGLPNRALFLDRLGVALDRSRRTNGAVAVLFLDVDNFKQVNDSLGHAAGDQLLAVLADRLRAMLRPMDTVARFGGDEFTLLFEDLDGEREVVLVAERISRAARVPIRLEENEVTITVSIGIAMVDDPSVPPDTVIREADAAMYRAKERGRSRYELFDEASKLRATKRLELESELRHAVEHSELRVHYQPRFALNGETRMTGFEALVRWEHPERGLIAPGEFIPLAEETGIVIPIGEYVLDSALRELAGWQIAQPDLTISINLSPRQLEDTGLASTLAAALRAAGLEPGTLCVEITESALPHNPEVAIRTLQALKAVGVRIAIDDYGTGAASLESLKRMPIDMLKLHQSFVGGLGGDPGAASIAGAVIELAHALGLSVVAEGVETDLQLGELRSLGCDAAQGFFLSQPVSGERAGEIVAGD
ncbi:MAG: EAL domain-containing protein [Actinomycetota bacterium]|nr:EAL domain-containing protein [Actinomycetota bacterium]